MNQIRKTLDKVSIHSTASHLNTYVPGSVRGAALRGVKFEEEADV